MQPALELKGIVKRFTDVLANDHTNLTVAHNEVHALLGENGAGKSTLMHVLYGSYEPDAGEILIDGKLAHFNSQRQAIERGIGMIHQDFMLVRSFTVVENIVLGLDDDRYGILDLNHAAKRIRELSDHYGLGVDPWARVEHLPVGVQQRVEILKLLYRQARILILDEPTAVLTPKEVERLLKTLRSLAAEGRSVIIVTHKLHEIMEVADQVTILRDGKTIACVAKHATSETELARMMVGRDVDLKISRSDYKRGQPSLCVSNLHVRDDRGELTVRGVDLTVHEGEIVGIAGVDGNGQSELVESLMGLRHVEQGHVEMDGTDITHAAPAEVGAMQLFYVPADRRGVGTISTLDIDANAILGQQRGFSKLCHLFLDRPKIRTYAKELVARFGIRTPGIRFPAEKLSGGNLQKLILGREIMRNPHMLIVEQPTRGLDVGAIEMIWAELLKVREQGKGILLVSAELEEIRNLADRILVMYGGRIMGELAPEEATDETLGLMMAGLTVTDAKAAQGAAYA
ncbi:MAG: ABC-type uncharacterized transport system ATPase subunit [Candidatus Azotimanducaceae bacterium]|jgi:ABC-type uncharacterized transport system ATPase subunit